MEPTENDIAVQLRTFSEALLKGDYSQRIIAPMDDSELSEVCRNLNLLADQLQINSVADVRLQPMVNSFIDVISSYANRDFNNKLAISGSGSIIDAIATGINILGEELEYTTVSKRELEEEHGRLKLANELSEKANKIKTVFLGNLSHEIRTPLQGIIGFSEILAGNSHPDKRVEHARIITKRANDLMQIIDDLLDLSVIESGEVEARPQLIALSTTVERIFYTICEDNFHRQVGPSLQINNKLPADQTVSIDPLHLRQVVVNLLNNGLKFTKQGTITLHCEKKDAIIVIQVSDTGIGIPADMVEIIFEPFRQVHEGFTRAKDGIGLGLAICRKRVEMWGGTIHVESTAGVGSTFTFTIPLTD